MSSSEEKEDNVLEEITTACSSLTRVSFSFSMCFGSPPRLLHEFFNQWLQISELEIFREMCFIPLSPCTEKSTMVDLFCLK
jgi:hypothetical protein